MPDTSQPPSGSGPESQFLRAYETYSDAIFRYVFFRTSDRERSLELVQDIFMRVWNFMRSGGDVSRMQAFIYTVASRVVIDEYRRRRPSASLDRIREEEGWEPSAEENGNPGDRLDGQAILAAVKRLPDRYRDAVLMRFMEDMSLSEIAGITDESENTIAVRIHRGMAKLRKLYTDMSGTGL